MRSRKPALRTIDVARAVGCSVQHVRDLETSGVLPPAARSDAGYRTYTWSHVSGALAYRAFSAAIGPVDAKRLVRAAHQRPADLVALVDEAHARLHRERRDVERARAAVDAITKEPLLDVRGSDAMAISELADALGVKPSTLRHWDAQGLVVPGRMPGGTARAYSPADVRDARIVHQLRQAGYRIAPLQDLMPDLRRAGRRDELVEILRRRREGIDARSRALLRGSAALTDVLADADVPVTQGAGDRSPRASSPASS